MRFSICTADICPMLRMVEFLISQTQLANCGA